MVRIVRGIKVHPAADAFPLIVEEKWGPFVEAVRRGAENKSLAAIELYSGEIIDGRNRWIALQQVGMDPKEFCVDKTSLIDDPIRYVLDTNLEGRRQLEPAQLGMVAADLAVLKRGSNQHADVEKSEDGSQEPCAKKKSKKNSKSKNDRSIDAISKELEVSRSTVKRCRTVKDKGSSAVIDAVKAGRLDAKTAEKLVNRVASKAEQTELLSKGKVAIKQAIEVADIKTNAENKPGSRDENKKEAEAKIAELEKPKESKKTEKTPDDDFKLESESKDRFDHIVDQLSDADLIKLVDRAFRKRSAVATAFDFVIVDNKMIDEVVETWNRLMSQAVTATKNRAALIKLRLKNQQWHDKWPEALAKLSKCDFANGDNNRGWTANIDFFLRPDTVVKILEGSYDSKKKPVRGIDSKHTDGDV